MQQNELAKLLDISPAMVSRLAKRGMPTDTVERAERWRKRHLEPGRVKGSRVDTIKPKQPPSPAKQANESPAALAATVADMEAVGDLIDGALNRGHQAAAAVRVMQLRMMFRQSTSVVEDEGVQLTVRVWVALLDYMIHQEVEIRRSQNMGEYLTAGECGERIAIEIGGWPGHTVMWECCDFDDNAINGWPDGDGELDD